MQNGDVPIYKQIAVRFKEAIIGGRLAEGGYLPSIRGLARDLNISVTTTLKAYKILVEDGFVSAKPGKGYIVNPQNKERVREHYLRLLEKHLHNAVKSAKLAGVSREEFIKMIKL